MAGRLFNNSKPALNAGIFIPMSASCSQIRRAFSRRKIRLFLFEVLSFSTKKCDAISLALFQIPFCAILQRYFMLTYSSSIELSDDIPWDSIDATFNCARRKFESGLSANEKNSEIPSDLFLE